MRYAREIIVVNTCNDQVDPPLKTTTVLWPYIKLFVLKKHSVMKTLHFVLDIFNYTTKYFHCLGLRITLQHALLL